MTKKISKREIFYRLIRRQSRIFNFLICLRYPFLRVRGAGYSCTWFDAIPEIWGISFGYELVKDIDFVLGKGMFRHRYIVTDIKEKWGQLRIYDNGVPEGIYREMEEVLSFFESLSYYTCFYCGNVSNTHSTGWILPVCRICAEEKGISAVPNSISI